MNSQELAAYVRAAAKQRQWLLPRRRDRKLQARGGTLIHAVDTDVVKLYTSPWEMAPHTERRKEGYAEIFPGEDRELVISLGTALAEFIFHSLSNQLPLVMLPPMGEELNDVFGTVAQKAERESDKVDSALGEIKQLVREAAGQEDPGQTTRKLAEHADRITRFLRGQEGPTAELRRFVQLLRATRIVPPEYLIDQGMIRDPVLVQALEPPTDLRDRLAFRELREQWFDRLHKTKSIKRRTVLTDADAQVLARIEWINAKLTPKDGEKPMYRLVLITGDQAVHTAGSQVRPWKRSHQGFAGLFLRHPRAYLGEPNVLNPPEDAETPDTSRSYDTQLDQWLDTWLGELRPGTDNFEETLKKLLKKDDQQLADWVEPLVETRPQLIERFRTSWANYTKNLVLARPPSALELRLANAQERGVIREYGDLIDKLSQAIDQRVQETWQRCFSVVAEGGYNLLRAARSPTDSKPPRNPPFLDFDRFTATREFVKKVLESYEAGGLNAEEWDRALKELKADDGSGYAFFVALGLLFAADGIWRVAGILANRAITIAIREEPEKISGREAYYLRAVALRHSSRNVHDLEPIAKLLEQAKESYTKDINGRPALKVGPCRFEAERWALFLTYHLYRVLLGARIDDPVPSLEQIQAGIEEMLGNLTSSREGEDVKRYIERNLLTNWLMASLLRLKDEGRPPDIARFEDYHQRLERNLERAGDALRPSYYVDAIRLTGSVLIAQNAVTRRACKKRALDWLDQHDKHSVMRYDAERFLLLRDIMEGRIR